jgi:large subunit ribosomal protein L5e
VLCSATSLELVKYGINGGYTNYAASYATGLLVARRLLTQLGLADTYSGVSEVTGELFDVSADMTERRNEGEQIARRPFKACLDIGLARSTKGNKVFAALKGASDGGLHVPHKTRCFPGATKNDKEWTYDAAVHRERIFGAHVASYMKTMKEEDPEKFDAHFSKMKDMVDLEGAYKKAHVAIRKDPVFVKKTPLANPGRTREGQMIKTSQGTYPREVRLTNAERKERVTQKIFNAQGAD